jgi:6-phosphofructokinase 1
VSEGAHQPGGKTWAEAMSSTNVERDAHGNIRLSGTGALGDLFASLVSQKLTPPGGRSSACARIRSAICSGRSRGLRRARWMRRGSRPSARRPPNSRRRAPECDGMLRLHEAREQHPVPIELDTTSIKNVARETKHLDRDFIKNGNDISQAFIDYARPLVGPLPAVGALTS